MSRTSKEIWDRHPRIDEASTDLIYAVSMLLDRTNVDETVFLLSRTITAVIGSALCIKPSEMAEYVEGKVVELLGDVAVEVLRRRKEANDAELN